ncbi:MAG TPA: VCBS repeat-containing protein [Vicinamibacterales bacterium]|nr:VCBS repeat-containing protein [Vicinamibacterales bacterium]
MTRSFRIAACLALAAAAFPQHSNAQTTFSKGFGLLRHTTYAGDDVGAPHGRITTLATAPVEDLSNKLVIAPTTGAGLVIHATFDSSITSNVNAAAIENAINGAISKEQARYKDLITVEIYFRFASTDPVTTLALSGGTLGQSYHFNYFNYTWTQYISDLTADSTTIYDSIALAHLPGSVGSTNVSVSSANGRAVGESSMTPIMSPTGALGCGGTAPTGCVYDGIITLNSTQPWQFTRPTTGSNYDAQRTVEHEMDEIMGLGSFIGTGTNANCATPCYEPQDMFSYSAASVPSVVTTGSRYLSIDGGVTNIVGFNQTSGGDFGDWLSGTCPQSLPYVQNAFGCNAQYADVTQLTPEAINLDVIGYDLVTTGTTTDFAGNDNNALVLRNYSTGQDALWIMTGTTLDQIVDLPALPNINYRFEGTADFNGDGQPDIVLRNYSTGQDALWIMSGTSLSKIVDLPALPNTSYHFQGTGDFNHDGHPDIILRNFSTGLDALWIMNGTSLSMIVDLPALPNTNYQFAGAADFNNDGNVDIVLRNYSTGQNALWLMHGTSLSTIVDLPALPNTNYRIDAVGDFNGDGKPDIVWRNYSTGQNAVWLMNGTSLSTIKDLPALPNTNYQFGGPR